MKMKIQVKELCEGLYTNAQANGKKLEFINPKGDCIDLRAADEYKFNCPKSDTLKKKKDNDTVVKYRVVRFDEQLIKLGLAMKLPDGMIASIRQRSSTTKKMGIVMASSGFIDTTYNGNNDEWGFYCYALRNSVIHKGDRICQFEIRPSQFATFWQKLRWLLTTKIEFVWVDSLNTENRGGFGSTGIN